MLNAYFAHIHARECTVVTLFLEGEKFERIVNREKVKNNNRAIRR